MQSRTLWSWLTVVALLAAGCAGQSTQGRAKLTSLIAQRDYDGAQVHLTALKEKEFGKTEEALYHLEMGALLHYAGKFASSEAEFDQAMKKMEELYTRSASKAVGSYMVNDNTLDYEGTAYDRALAMALHGLNFAYEGKKEDAVVEARNISQYLQERADRLKADSKVQYRQDAFAHYLAGLLYEDAGMAEDAKLSFASASMAYAAYKAAYNTPEPTFDVPEDPEKGELVFIHYNGLAPRLTGQTIQVAWNNCLATVTQNNAGDSAFQNALNAGVVGNAITVAFPDYVQDPYIVRSSVVDVDGLQAPSNLMEDISAIATNDLKDRLESIKTRAIIRATIKYVLSKAGEIAATKAGGGTVGALAGWVGKTASAGTEIADTRGWGLLPAEIRMARIKLTPGVKNISVHLLSADGQAVETVPLPPVTVVKGQRVYVGYRSAI